MKPYHITLTHRLYDWDASLKFLAPNARTARLWALQKMAQPGDWLVSKACIAKATGSAS